MDRKIKTVIFVFLLALLWVPLIQQATQIFKEPELKGAFVKPEKPTISITDIASLSFQKKTEDYENSNFGFRAFFVKVKNSLEYIFFRELSVNDNVAGKDGFIFSVYSVYRTRGQLYNGKNGNDSIVRKIKLMKDGIERHGAHLLVLIVPSKESVLPDFLPPSFRSINKEETDYEDDVQDYQKYHIPFIDLVSYFKTLRDTGAYPLFTKTGFHWSMYAASVAQDTLVKYIQHTVSKPMPSYKYTGVEWSDKPREPDADFEGPLNLFFSLNQPRYAYRKLEMDKTTLGNYRPRVLIIGDSFFWQIKEQKKLRYIFSDESKYWYYFATTSYALNDDQGIPLKTLDLPKEIESADYVVLIGSLGNTNCFPFGITEYYLENVVSNKILNNLVEDLKTDSMWISSYTHNFKPGSFEFDSLVREKALEIYEGRKGFYLKACNGRYVSDDNSHNDPIVANQDHAFPWELFSMWKLENNKCAITAFTNKFLTAELAKKNEITATREAMYDWEKFTLIELGNDTVAFMATNGKFLSVDERTSQLFADGESIGRKEKFKLIWK